MESANAISASAQPRTTSQRIKSIFSGSVGNLVDWYDSSDTPIILDTDGSIDLVSVPYPFFLPDFTKAKFFRVLVEFTQ